NKKRPKLADGLQDSLSAQLKQFESLHQRLKAGDGYRDQHRDLVAGTAPQPKQPSVVKRAAARKVRRDAEKATTRETSKYQPPAFKPGTLLQLLPKSSPPLVFANAG